MDHLPSLLSAYAVFVAAAATPGANVLAVAGSSMRGGRASGLSVALGIGTGTSIWAASVVLGMSSALSALRGFTWIVGLFGAAYLGWLGWRSLRASKRVAVLQSSAIAEPSLRSGFLKGLLVQLTNPKVLLFWVAITSILAPAAPSWVRMALVLGIASLSLLIHGGYALAFSSAPVRKAYEGATPRIERIQGLVFMALAALLLVNALRMASESLQG